MASLRYPLFLALVLVPFSPAAHSQSLVPLETSWDQPPNVQTASTVYDFARQPIPKEAEGVVMESGGLTLGEAGSSTMEGVWSPWQAIPGDCCTGRTEEQIGGILFLSRQTRSIQARMHLWRTGPDHAPAIRLLHVSFISPGATPQRVLEQIQRVKVEKAALPSYHSRTGWGCPEGQRADAEDPKWTPQTTSVTHLVVHHTAGSNSASDWPAVVRAIWSYHKYPSGNNWGDIGYNWLIDPNGVLYQGRSWWISGDDSLKDVVGAHFSCANTGTMGVALLGNFSAGSPTASARTSLEQLLAWKCEQRNLSPTGSAYHTTTQLTLSRICGHRDANGSPAACSTTECPGNVLYDALPSIRSDVTTLIDGGGSDCGLAVNDTVRVVNTGSLQLRVRNGAGTSNTILGNRPDGSVGVIQSGPVSADGYLWWDIQWSGLRGWSAQGDGTTCWLEAIDTHTPTPTQTHTLTRTFTRTPTITVTDSKTPTFSNTPTLSTPTFTPTRTFTPVGPTSTATRPPTVTNTPSGPTNTPTPTSPLPGDAEILAEALLNPERLQIDDG